MKNGLNGPVPWDIAVFLIVTIVGFGYTIQNFSQRHSRSSRGGTARALASTAAPDTPTVTGLLDLGCLDQKPAPEKVIRETGPLRVKGRLCRSPKGEKLIEAIRVKNLSNGHEATVYFQGHDASFVTDYINMNSGKNDLEVRWKDSPAEEPKTFVAEVFEK